MMNSLRATSRFGEPSATSRSTSSSRRLEDPEDLARLDRERDVVDRDLLAVALVQVGDFDDCHAFSVEEAAVWRIGFPARAFRARG
jgi:hypothetical protein